MTDTCGGHPCTPCQMFCLGITWCPLRQEENHMSQYEMGIIKGVHHKLFKARLVLELSPAFLKVIPVLFSNTRVSNKDGEILIKVLKKLFNDITRSLRSH